MKPKIIFLADRKGWVFSSIAQEVIRRLKDKYKFSLYHSMERLPDFKRLDFDLLYIFFWGDGVGKKFNIPPHKVIREVASYRWRHQSRYGNLSAEGFCRRYLNDCNYVVSPCRRMVEELSVYRSKVLHVPNGINSRVYKPSGTRQGKLRIGWAGNPNDSIKGLYDILLPATQSRFDFVYTDGSLSRRQMVEFYNSIDVLAIASVSESQPMPLMESMACGCYPVTTDVGIASELIRDGDNGLIVSRDVDSFVKAFSWCEENIEHVRLAGMLNARFIHENRSWENVISGFDQLFSVALDSESHDIEKNFKAREMKEIVVPPEPKNDSSFGDYSEHLACIQGSYGESYRMVKAGLFKEISPLLPVDKGQAILEIGAGFGYLINLLLDMGYTNVVTADISRGLIQLLRSRFSGRLKGAYWCDGNEILACNPDTFDLIFLYDMLEHISPNDLETFVLNLKNALTEGGRAIVRTPNMALPLSGFSRYIDITHKTGFTEFSLRQLFHSAGFSSVNFLPQKLNKGWKYDLMFRLYRYLLRKIYLLEGRTMPMCFHKNLLVEVWK